MTTPTSLLISIVLIVLTGVTGAVASPDQSASILSFTSGLVVVLVASLRAQQHTYDQFNSRVNELMAARREADRLEGAADERARADEAAKEERAETTKSTDEQNPSD